MREQEFKLAKVKKSCNTARKVTKAIQIILIVAAIISMVGVGICMMYKTDINTWFAAHPESVSLNSIDGNGILSIDYNVESLAAAGEYAQILIGYCAYSAAYCIFFSIIFRMIRKVFVLIGESESPFSEGVMKRLKRSFRLLTVVTALFISVGTAVFVGLFLWCVYCIMDYGTALQTEVDEIL